MSRIVIVLVSLTIACMGYCLEPCREIFQDDKIRIVEDGCEGSTYVVQCKGTCESSITPRTYFNK